MNGERRGKKWTKSERGRRKRLKNEEWEREQDEEYRVKRKT